VGRAVLRALTVGLAAAAMLLPIACAPAAPPAPSPPGRYAQGSAVVLANGNRLTVPGGWEAGLNTTGAAIQQSPELTGAVGGYIWQSTSPNMGRLILSVYGPDANFEGARSSMEAAAKLSPTLPNGPTTTRTSFVYHGAKVTAFTILPRPGETRHYMVVLLVERQGVSPFSLVASMSEIPPAFGVASPEKLPRRLLDCVRLQVR
jgi:hypothetical protein